MGFFQNFSKRLAGNPLVDTVVSRSPRTTQILRATRQDNSRLYSLFWDLNAQFFGGILPVTEIRFSSRLQTTGGQYFKKPKRLIQISTRYLAMEKNWEEIRDTLGHEMVHYWLDFMGLPCGHTALFRKKLNECGFNRYSRLTPVRARYLFVCAYCSTAYYRRRRGVWSCGPCSGTTFNPRFKLLLAGRIQGPDQIEWESEELKSYAMQILSQLRSRRTA